MSKLYKSWRDFPLADWRWPDFSPQEMACRGTGKLMIHEPSMDALQALRTKLGKPMIVNSAYRSPEHNRAVGGASRSMHLKAQAFDVSMANHNPHEVAKAARACGFRGFGEYVSQNFMHIDTRATPAHWTGSDGKTFPKQTPTPGFQPEPKPDNLVQTITKPEVLGPAGGVLSGGAAMAQGNGPVQWALGVGMVMLIAFGIFMFIRRQNGQKPKD